MKSDRPAIRARRFQGLMPYRVREVLLVSSPFDAFVLEEDGLLTDRLFFEYIDIALPSSPGFTHVPSGARALEEVDQRRFDLVLTMSSLSDMDVGELARRVRERQAGLPVVLLSLDTRELHDRLQGTGGEAFDGAFLWSGDARILLAIIKYVEDKKNVDHDIAHGNVRVVLMLEDSPRYYSSFLGLLYKELMLQSRSLYAEGIDELHRQMYVKSRPKILHAVSYEQGLELFERYKRNIMAIICDLRLPYYGELRGGAGLEFAEMARRYDPTLPVLIQSAEGVGARRAGEMDAVFLDKNSPTLLAETRSFLRRNLGFGAFVFRLPNGEEIERATDLRQFAEALQRAPEESLVYHAANNHFSLWLQARSEFELAERLKPQQVSDFSSVAATREYLLEMLQKIQSRTHRGVVSDYSRSDFEHQPFSRLGRGALGGKARGLAFLNRALTRYLPSDFGGMRVRVPQTVVITTDFFDQFVTTHGLDELARTELADEEIGRRFLEARLPGELEDELAFLASQMEGPLAVRSSSLLEDSLHQRLAGVYTTIMLPNLGPGLGERVHQLASAVKLVWASTYYANARSYMDRTGHLLEEEKMAVILQPLVGAYRGDRYYPSFSAVAQSFNHYPIGPQSPADGCVHLALGLGRIIVEGGRTLRFSPEYPQVLPQFPTARDVVVASQREFYALDLEHQIRDLPADLFSTVATYGLDVAEADGSLHAVGSVYLPDEDRILDDLGADGPRAVTFANFLVHRALPLPEAISGLLAVAADGLGTEVELEIACELAGDSAASGPGSDPFPALHVLQVRPFSAGLGATDVPPALWDERSLLCSSDQCLGHGEDDTLCDIVYVKPDRWSAEQNPGLAAEVGRLNRALRAEERRYLLIGPGRWGTADPWLGIPVQWHQISNVKVVVEASPDGYHVEPSQGTHFFQNMTSLGLGYLNVAPERIGPTGAQAVDWGWLEAQPAHSETDFLRHVRLPSPIRVILDGRSRRGVICRPDESP